MFKPIHIKITDKQAALNSQILRWRDNSASYLTPGWVETMKNKQE